MEVQFSRMGSPNTTSACNANVTSQLLLKRVTIISKYIFTGKVYGVVMYNDTRVYKVNIRRVLKGDLHDIGLDHRRGEPDSLRFIDSTILVQSAVNSMCKPLRVRNYAIFLTHMKYGKNNGAIRLSLVIEPVLLTLRSNQSRDYEQMCSEIIGNQSEFLIMNFFTFNHGFLIVRNPVTSNPLQTTELQTTELSI
ncbi:unnamed protein product [Leptidea sinapis]|uniref:Uncharacterized protein n=1 Tax=Leptidea sinapis TaxID=189913 RepID=A0A5E4QLV5_9NEOP|nr:unnamed protein product [Leptidea sinapis]